MDALLEVQLTDPVACNFVHLFRTDIHLLQRKCKIVIKLFFYFKLVYKYNVSSLRQSSLVMKEYVKVNEGGQNVPLPTDLTSK